LLISFINILPDIVHFLRQTYTNVGCQIDKIL